jgi:hypothetical protein
VTLRSVPPAGSPIQPFIDVVSAGTRLEGPKNNQYSTPLSMFQVTVAEDSPAVATTPEGPGADSPPHEINSKVAINVAMKNLSERSDIKKPR